MYTYADEMQIRGRVQCMHVAIRHVNVQPACAYLSTTIDLSLFFLIRPCMLSGRVHVGVFTAAVLPAVNP